MPHLYKAQFSMVVASLVCGLSQGCKCSEEEPRYRQEIATIEKFSVGGDTTCFIEPSGALYCFGNLMKTSCNSERPKPGVPLCENTHSTLPRKILFMTPLRGVFTEESCDCVIHEDRTVVCWGSNMTGLLGVEEYKVFDRRIVPGIQNAAAIESNGATACAQTVEGEIFCWGGNVVRGKTRKIEGLVHKGPFTVTTLSFPPTGKPTQRWGSVLCGVDETHTAFCLGDYNDNAPQKWLEGTCVTKVKGGPDALCALTCDDKLLCQEPAGWLRPNGEHSPTPEPLEPLAGIVDFSVGQDFVCAANASEIRCFGPTIDEVKRAFAVDFSRVAVKDVVELQSSNFHSCALTKDKKLYCFGKTNWGQVSGEVSDEPNYDHNKWYGPVLVQKPLPGQ
jgi:alpha-tubulin suppressor-like RCC1 family protein